MRLFGRHVSLIYLMTTNFLFPLGNIQIYERMDHKIKSHHKYRRRILVYVYLRDLCAVMLISIQMKLRVWTFYKTSHLQVLASI